jgi:hypothetical protein
VDKAGTLTVGSSAVSVLDDGTLSFADNATVSHFSLKNIDSITGGQAQNTFILYKNTSFDGLIKSNLGTDDALFVLNGDNMWQIDGLDSGQVGMFVFQGWNT